MDKMNYTSTEDVAKLGVKKPFNLSKLLVKLNENKVNPIILKYYRDKTRY